MSPSQGTRALRAAPARSDAWIAWWLAGVAVAVFALVEQAHGLAGEPVCLLRRIAHLACPTCGMTRALVLLAGGKWQDALATHPWAVVLAAQILGGWVLCGVTLARGAATRLDRWLPHIMGLNSAALVLLWLARLVTGTLPRP